MDKTGDAGRRDRGRQVGDHDDTDGFDPRESYYASRRQQADDTCQSTPRALSSRDSSQGSGVSRSGESLWLSFATLCPTLEQAVAAERLVLEFGESLRGSPPESQTSSAWLLFLRTLVATLNSRD